MAILRFKWFHLLGSLLFISQLVGLPEAVFASMPKYFLCIHSKKKIAKNKLCPCGCNKIKMSLMKLKIVDPDHACASDSEQAILPAYTNWVFTVTPIFHSAMSIEEELFSSSILKPKSFFIEQETPPPRIFQT